MPFFVRDDEAAQLKRSYIALEERYKGLCAKMNWLNAENQAKIDQLTSENQEIYDRMQIEVVRNERLRHDMQVLQVEFTDSMLVKNQENENLRSIIRQLKEEKTDLKERLQQMMERESLRLSELENNKAGLCAEEDAQLEEKELVEEAAQPEEKELVEEAAQPEETEPVEEAAPSEEKELVEEAAQSEETKAVEEAAQLGETEFVEETAQPEETKAVEEAAQPEETEPVEEAAPSEEKDLAEEAAPSEAKESVERAAQPKENEPVEESAMSEENEPVKGVAQLKENEPVEEAAPSEEKDLAEEAAQLEGMESVEESDGRAEVLDHRTEELADWERRLTEREARLPSVMECRRETVERMERLNREVRESKTLLSRMTGMQSGREFLELQRSFKRFSVDVVHLRKLVMVNQYINGMEQLAQLHRKLEHMEDDTACYAAGRLEKILKDDFGIEKVEPAEGCPYDEALFEPFTLCDAADTPIVKRCCSCGWKLDEELLMRAVVEMEDKK